MLLHDSFFFLSNRSINETHYSPITIAHSPLFHSTLTLIISIFGICSNFLCLIYLRFIIRQYKRNKFKQHKSFHIISRKLHRFLIILTSNDLLLCLASCISCLDEKFYFQTLIAHYHLCSFHILIWKFSLHFTPLLTVFILCRYHYILNKKFPSKFFNTTTYNQLFFTDLCLLIPFVIALSWSVDGLWLWGETNIKNYVALTKMDHELNQTNEMPSGSTVNRNVDYSDIRLEQYYNEKYYLAEQKIICYLQTNTNLNFTARLLQLIQADFLLLFLLHFIGFCLEISLHIRLCCCSIGRKVNSSIIREQQISLYILYIFLCITLTSIPFYFYRSMEILFDFNISLLYYDLINSRTLAQIILCGISFKPVLYFILLFPSKILYKFNCYTAIKLDSMDHIDNILLNNQPNKNYIKPGRFSLNLESFYPRIHQPLRTSSTPIITTSNRMLVNKNENVIELE